jgi:hypothetical protein
LTVTFLFKGGDKMDKKDIAKIGKYCKDFRENTLKISLTNFCEINSEKIKNVSAFENGRANNIKYLFLYYRLSIDKQRKIFLEGLFNQL